jgi:hypothetical protein
MEAKSLEKFGRNLPFLIVLIPRHNNLLFCSRCRIACNKVFGQASERASCCCCSN